MLLLTVLTICAPGLSTLPSAAQGQEEIATYTNKRFGFTLSYPTARFQPKEPLSEEGRQWISHDGNARLLAGASALWLLLPSAATSDRVTIQAVSMAVAEAVSRSSRSPTTSWPG